MKKLECTMTFDCPGKWEIETTEDGEFSIKNLADAAVSVDLPFNYGLAMSGDQTGSRVGFAKRVKA